MPRTRIKICGVRHVETALAAAAAGADAIGLVFAPQSPRRITVQEATRIAAALPAWVEPVGLFVNEPVDRIRRIAADVGLRTVQLHGDESQEAAAALRPLAVVKKLTIGQINWSHWMHVNAVLFDTPVATGEMPGGTGRTFDWSQLSVLDDAPPIILAGGLNPDNVAAAIAAVHPFGVDVSSGVESEPAVKSIELIAAFCDAVRRADEQQRCK
ncbi:MAG: phosphoribosylanthranilate isomerase [Phycisphaeraceae bacterium]|nr:phosphoribosylanthranilate isomerase [Phycisphaeraceae bacterium]